MQRYSKLNSTQAGSFSYPANRMIDIEIPEGLVCNLNESFIQLLLHLNVDTDDVYNLCVKSTTNEFTPMNLDLIRNCSMTGSKVGRLEDIRRVNVLKHNLNLLSKSSQEKMSLVDSIFQTTDFYSQQTLSPFVEMYKYGNVASTYKDCYLRIPLKDLFELGNTTIDTSKTGKLTVHLELENLSYLTVTQITLMNKQEQTQMNEITTTSNLSQLRTLVSYPSLEQSPFFVGQQLLLEADTTDPSGSNLTPQTITITNITRAIDPNNPASVYNSSLYLDFTPAIADPGAFIWENVRVNETEPTISANIQVETCELGLCEVVGQKENINELQYMTWSTEEYTNGAQKMMNKVFEIENNCVNAFLMFDSNDSNLISNNVGVTSYRMRIDNVDQYDRDIETNKSTTKENYIHDALHYDAITRTMLNADIPLKDISFLGPKRGVAASNAGYLTRFNQENQQVLICACPTPLTQNTKKLQFNLVADKELTSNIQNVILYKQIVKSIKF